MKYIDLHVHSNYSDGTCSPTKLVALAKKAQLSAIALTDHDTTDGLAKIFEAAGETDIEIIPGIEFSTEYLGIDIHILGLDMDWASSNFQTQLMLFKDSRKMRNEKMIKKLADTGIDISWEQMQKRFGKAVWTRAHFALYLLEHDYVKDIAEVFTKYIGDHSPYFVPREKVTPVQAVHLIRQYGGIPILAHPLAYGLSKEQLQILLEELKKAGLIGLEAIYSTHSKTDEDYLRQLARINQLGISGGSDFHGNNKPDIQLGIGKGNLRIPYDILKQLREIKNKE